MSRIGLGRSLFVMLAALLAIAVLVIVLQGSTGRAGWSRTERREIAGTTVPCCEEGIVERTVFVPLTACGWSSR